MHKKKIILLTMIAFLVTSCGGTWDSVKRGLTGAKKNSADEFLVEKKDPLILPPDFDKLPTPDDRDAAKKELSEFEKQLGKTILEDVDSSSPASNTEESILEKIKNQ